MHSHRPGAKQDEGGPGQGQGPGPGQGALPPYGASGLMGGAVGPGSMYMSAGGMKQLGAFGEEEDDASIAMALASPWNNSISDVAVPGAGKAFFGADSKDGDDDGSSAMHTARSSWAGGSAGGSGGGSGHGSDVKSDFHRHQQQQQQQQQQHKGLGHAQACHSTTNTNSTTHNSSNNHNNHHGHGASQSNVNDQSMYSFGSLGSFGMDLGTGSLEDMDMDQFLAREGATYVADSKDDQGTGGMGGDSPQHKQSYGQK